MKTLYLDCSMGAAGDMLMAALLELHPDPDGVISQLNALDLPGVQITREASVKCGVTGTHVSVKVHGTEEKSEDIPRHAAHPHTAADESPDSHHDHANAHGHHHHHTTMEDIRRIIGEMNLPEAVRRDIWAVYSLLAEAESHVHGTTVDQIHFHEVGTMDAVADVTGVCLLMHDLAPDKVVVSPVHVGSGQVRCQHGILPVPAPATAELLQGIPIYGGSIQGELCTPTGAALLRHFADSFGPMPSMCVAKIGYGMGTKDFEAANCVRALFGEAEGKAPNDQIVCLECNLDDMTGEALGFAMDRLFEAGARDVFFQPIQMKKNRPGVMLSCICLPDESDKMAELMFRYTTTLGVRRKDMARYALSRRIETRQTPWGEIRYKVSEGYGVSRAKPEYADLESAARQAHCSVAQMTDQLAKFQDGNCKDRNR